MSEFDVDFVCLVIARVKESGNELSRDLIKDVYLEDLCSKGMTEALVVSEKWIDFYWQRLSSVPFARLEKAAASPAKLAKLLIELIGK